MADGFQELTIESLQTVDGVSNLVRMLNELYNNMGGDGQSVRIFNGYGDPEGVVTAGIGSMYLRKDGGTDTTLYRKESGTGATGWVAVKNFSLPLSIANGGTGQTTAQAAIDALLPAQGSANGKFLKSDGNASSWGLITNLALGSWASKSVNTNYQAATDGFVIAMVTSGESNEMVGYTDSGSSPSTIRARGGNYYNSSDGYLLKISITMPVKKNDYYRIEGPASYSIIYWLPLA